MTTQHTPGPWKTFEGYDATVIRTTKRNALDITPRAVAWATHHGEYHEQNGERTAYQQATAEDRANGRLIAAAPDLLEACIFAKRIMEQLEPITGLKAMIPALSEISNAIAKAQGE